MPPQTCVTLALIGRGPAQIGKPIAHRHAPALSVALGAASQPFSDPHPLAACASPEADGRTVNSPKGDERLPRRPASSFGMVTRRSAGRHSLRRRRSRTAWGSEVRGRIASAPLPPARESHRLSPGGDKIEPPS